MRVERSGGATDRSKPQGEFNPFNSTSVNTENYSVLFWELL
jgi:hypothetical protein